LLLNLGLSIGVFAGGHRCPPAWNGDVLLDAVNLAVAFESVKEKMVDCTIPLYIT
jgi:hypothetical protein